MIRILSVLAVLSTAACSEQPRVLANMVGVADPCPLGWTDVLAVDQPTAGNSFKVCARGE